MTRIGLYAGAFNPVHIGHITFALQALQQAKLDVVYFLPERRPRHKPGIEHFGHRVAMLQRALAPYSRFQVLELDELCFSVPRTLPKLISRFAGAETIFLFGSDVGGQIGRWPDAAKLLDNSEIVIGLRHKAPGIIDRLVADWPTNPKRLHQVDSYAPDISSDRIREALHRRRDISGILKSVKHYSNRNWLYVSVA